MSKINVKIDPGTKTFDGLKLKNQTRFDHQIFTGKTKEPTSTTANARTSNPQTVFENESVPTTQVNEPKSTDKTVEDQEFDEENEPLVKSPPNLNRIPTERLPNDQSIQSDQRKTIPQEQGTGTRRTQIPTYFKVTIFLTLFEGYVDQSDRSITPGTNQITGKPHHIDGPSAATPRNQSNR